MQNVEKSTLILNTYYASTFDSNPILNNSLTWKNIDLKVLLGSMWNKYKTYNLVLNKIVGETCSPYYGTSNKDLDIYQVNNSGVGVVTGTGSSAGTILTLTTDVNLNVGIAYNLSGTSVLNNTKITGVSPILSGVATVTIATTTATFSTAFLLPNGVVYSLVGSGITTNTTITGDGTSKTAYTVSISQTVGTGVTYSLYQRTYTLSISQTIPASTNITFTPSIGQEDRNLLIQINGLPFYNNNIDSAFKYSNPTYTNPSIDKTGTILGSLLLERNKIVDSTYSNSIATFILPNTNLVDIKISLVRHDYSNPISVLASPPNIDAYEYLMPQLVYMFDIYGIEPNERKDFKNDGMLGTLN